jgi:hypothetical protein
MTRRRVTTLVATLAVLAATMTTTRGPAGAGAPVPRADGPPEGAVLFFPRIPDQKTVSFWQGQRAEDEDCCDDTPGTVGQALVGNFDGDGFDEVYAYSIGTYYQFHARPSIEDTPEGPVFDLSLIGSHLSGLYIPLVGDFGGPTGPGGRSIDDILWYAPGSARDTLWIHKPDGAASRYHLRIDGSYRPVVLEGNGSEPESIIWYAPGRAADSIWDFRDVPTGGHRTHPLRVDGDYQPTSFATDGARLVHWYSATGHDSTWRFDGVSAGAFRFANLSTPQVAGTRRPIALDRGSTAGVLLYAPGPAPDIYVGTTDATGGTLGAASTQIWGDYRHIVAGDVTSAAPGQSDGVDELVFGGAGRGVMWRMPTIDTRIETVYEGLPGPVIPAVVATELPPG